MTYSTIFTVSAAGIAVPWGPYVGGGVGLAGALYVLLCGVRVKLTTRLAICLAAAVIMSFASHWASVRTETLNRIELAQGPMETVEGRVEEFKAMPYAGHDVERFRVGGEFFSYSDYVETGGFNNTSSHGGPIREGIPVRIGFVRRQNDNVIVRLEVGAAQP